MTFPEAEDVRGLIEEVELRGKIARLLFETFTVSEWPEAGDEFTERYLIVADAILSLPELRAALVEVKAREMAWVALSGETFPGYTIDTFWLNYMQGGARDYWRKQAALHELAALQPGSTLPPPIPGKDWNLAIEAAARLVETTVISGPDDEEVDHDDYRDCRMAEHIRALSRK